MPSIFITGMWRMIATTPRTADDVLPRFARCNSSRSPSPIR